MLIARLGNVLIARLVILCIMHALKILYLWHLKNIVHIAPQKYCTYGTSKILCILHLKNIVPIAPQKYFVPMVPQKYCAYCTRKIYIVPMAPQRALCLWHLKDFVPMAPQRLCCLQLCRLLPLLHLQQKIFFRLRWQGRQNSHGACRQCWPRKELGSPSRRQRRQLSSG